MIYNGKFKVPKEGHFGNRILNGVPDDHKGIDIVGVTEKNIRAVADGVVAVSTILSKETDRTDTWQWGNYVRVDTDDGLRMYYCHMSRRLAAVGQRVKAGDILGIEGNTGYSFGSHCHFEVRKNGISVNPAPYLGIVNRAGTYQSKSYADRVCEKCGLEAQTRAYLNKYRYADDLWRKLWEAME